jgi:1,4-alpha-glucan branching enzyme
MGNMKKNVGAIARRGGVSFRVWAPFAESVAVAGSFNNWGEYPLENEEDGYWATIVPDARPGQEYKYVIKNGDKTLYRNDPRALHFTISAGNSVIAAPGFDWGNEPFKAASPEEQVIYEIHVGTFNRPDRR